MSDLNGNPEGRFSHDMTQIKQRMQHVWVSVVNSFRFCDIEFVHAVQRRMISVDNFFCIFEIIIFCCVVAICDLVHDVKTIFHL